MMRSSILNVLSLLVHNSRAEEFVSIKILEKQQNIFICSSITLNVSKALEISRGNYVSISHTPEILMITIF